MALPSPSAPRRVPIIPPEVRQEVDRELQPDEKVMWIGQPSPAGLRRGSKAHFLFGLPFTAFAVFWTTIAFTQTEELGMAGRLVVTGFGMIFVIAGLVLILSPLWHPVVARRTIYAITDRRAILWQGRPFSQSKVHRFNPARLASLHRRDRADGSGDLIFEEFTSDSGTGHSIVRRGFFSIEEVQTVEDLLRQTLLANRQKPAR